MFLILKDNHPFLKSKMEKYKGDTTKLIKISNEMVETMTHHGGIGLSANQVGLSHNMFVMGHESVGFKTIINPEIILKSKETRIEKEGCLSFPETFYKIKRAFTVTLKYTDLTGKDKVDIFADIWARCVQHEVQHLNGITFDTLKHYK